MPNKTVTIHPAIEVPEGEYCNKDERCLHFYIGSVIASTTTKACRIFREELKGCANLYTKCQPCKDLCERESVSRETIPETEERVEDAST